MVRPSYVNFSIGITLLHHNGTTTCVRGWEEIQQGLYQTSNVYMTMNILACPWAGTCFAIMIVHEK